MHKDMSSDDALSRLSELISDDALLARVRLAEDNFTERKTFANSKEEWLRTVVAFANSIPIGYPGVLFIGVKDDRSAESSADRNLEKAQKTFSEVVNKVYPRPYIHQRVLQYEGHEILAVIVPGSPNRPHFAGPAYVRIGPETTDRATEEQFNALIAERSSKACEIRRWVGKRVTLTTGRNTRSAYIRHCNQHYLTFNDVESDWNKDLYRSMPLERVELSYDHKNNCLHVIVQNVPML
jgi:hypothetical protein